RSALPSFPPRRSSDLVCGEVTRSLFNTARQYRESFDVYGSKKSFEWQQVENEEPILHELGKPEPEIPKRVQVPDYAHRLPEPIQDRKSTRLNSSHVSI